MGIERGNRLICLNWAEIYLKINRNYSYFGILPPMGLDHLPPTGQNGTPYGESSEMDLEAVGKEASRLNISDSNYLLCKGALQ
jgi:hypothetical protein